MKLSKVVSHVKSLREFLREIDPEVADKFEAGFEVPTQIHGEVTDAKQVWLKAKVERTRELVAAMDEELEVTREDREAFVDEQLRAIREALETADAAQRSKLEAKERMLKLSRAALLAAGVFQGVVVWEEQERVQINQLMAAAEADLANRRKLTAAVSITVNALKTSLSIARKVALPA